MVRIRSPSTGAQSGTHGREPVDTSATSNGMRTAPCSVSASTVLASTNRPRPLTSSTPCDRSMSVAPWARVPVMLSRWSVSLRMSSPTCPASLSPTSLAMRMAAIRVELATIAFEGMQSHRWAAPPTMASSTRVTSAPSVAATVAAALPAGPPPTTTMRTRLSLCIRLLGSPVGAAQCAGRWRPKTSRSTSDTSPRVADSPRAVFIAGSRLPSPRATSATSASAFSTASG